MQEWKIVSRIIWATVYSTNPHVSSFGHEDVSVWKKVSQITQELHGYLKKWNNDCRYVGYQLRIEFLSRLCHRAEQLP